MKKIITILIIAITITRRTIKKCYTNNNNKNYLTIVKGKR